MSFVPVTGPARLLVGQPPREGSIEFTDDRRTIVMPIRGALPVLGKVRDQSDIHPSVALLAGAALMGLQLVASGRFAPDPDGRHWQAAGLDADDERRIADLARSRAWDGFDEATAEGMVRGLLDAVVDTMPRTTPGRARRGALAPVRPTARDTSPDDFSDQLQQRIARIRSRGRDDRPHLVTISFRIEADEEELVAGAVRLVTQVHAVDNAAHMADASELWAETGPEAGHGFGERARTHAAIALRSAADAWPVLERLLDLRIPDEITLDTDEILSLLDGGAAALTEVGHPVMWPKYLDREVTQRVELGRRSAAQPRGEPLQDGLFGPQALFGFEWQLSLHGDELTDDEMDELARATSPIIKLRDNWVAVDSAVIKRARKRLIRTITPVQAIAATLTGVVDIEEVPYEAVVGASLLVVRDRLREAATGEPIDVPPGLRAELRDYQRRGLSWLAELTSLGLGACLADDMGLGKTITLIALHLHRAGEGPTLVVCPASLLGNWEAEIHRFAPGVPVRRHHGSARDLDGVTDGFVLTTYGTMRNDAALLAEVPWDLVVADEAQHIKNSRSAAARALRTVPSRARVALTGTPVENDLTELWSILDWAIPGLLGSRNAFRKVWAGPIESGLEPTKARQFADLIGPFLLRRRKSDPGIAPELPAKTETDHVLGLTREQVVLYETLVRESMRRIEEADEETRRGLVLKLLTGLKQICNHPAHFLRQANPKLRGRSEKLDLLDELVGTVIAEDGAVLVFTQYVAMARLLERHLASTGVPHQFLHGGTPVRERDAMVARFQAGELPVFLLSLKAGGTGLNLTRADHVIHFDRWWNPAVEDQATDRAYRIGQTRPVQVHRAITQGTIEEKIAELLTRKRSIADSVLTRGETALTELTNAELRDLVELRTTG
ncbi:Superfamily II DNA or RNA helicase, SNF2 family [Nocardioides alpinus]|uniref:ATP-dependent helicase n=1 Tax=Nocardioides alpinus TaxID=748909 RepID=A0A1I0Z615_9ACTN|nr:DEAD/DEAH box helicase [Nocardioides alpinus]PKH38279.1 ATP-dependent helicase [Nocardioides alpinus]SFB20852.1 Superfamily II DNA or RNA helicase, SNF2 family [Nocardioides alpinus]